MYNLAKKWLEDIKNTGTVISIDINILETVCKCYCNAKKDRNELFKELYPIFKKDRTNVILQLLSALNKPDGQTYNKYKLYLKALRIAKDTMLKTVY